MDWLTLLLLVAGAYLAGAIPSGLLVGRAVGRDPLASGSGKLGTANTLNSAGPAAAAVVFLLDFAKGALVAIIARMLPWSSTAVADLSLGLGAGAAIVGHNWSLWVRLITGRWGGGRGIVTAIGSMLVVSWPVVAAAVIAGGLAGALTRYMAVGALAGACAGILAALALGLAGQMSWWLAAGATAWGLLVIAGFHDNIGRLLAGTETKLGSASGGNTTRKAGT